MLGRVGQILKTILSFLVHCIVTALSWMSFSKLGYAYQQITGLMIRTVQGIKNLVAQIPRNKDQLLALSRTLLGSLMNLVFTLVLVILGVTGLLAQIIVHLLHKLALKIQRKEQ